MSPVGLCPVKSRQNYRFFCNSGKRCRFGVCRQEAAVWNFRYYPVISDAEHYSSGVRCIYRLKQYEIMKNTGIFMDLLPEPP